MESKKILGTLTGLGLWFSVTSSAAVGQMSAAMPAEPEQTGFRRIEQPFSLKLGVTLGGIVLVGTELWWFLLSKPKAQQVKARQGSSEADD